MRRARVLAPLLVGAGVILLIAAGVVAYPYVASRMATASSASLPPTQGRVVATARPTGIATVRSTGEAVPDPKEVSPKSSPVSVSPLGPTVVANLAEPASRQTIGLPPSRIVIPALSLDAPIVTVSRNKVEVNGRMQVTWGVPHRYAAGWHETSARLGEVGNIVLNGHNTNHGEIFRDLYTLETDDKIILYSEEISRTFAVSETVILSEAGQPLEVRIENARYAKPTRDARLTVITCHPYGSLRNRLIVIARPSRANLSSNLKED